MFNQLTPHSEESALEFGDASPYNIENVNISYSAERINHDIASNVVLPTHTSHQQTHEHQPRNHIHSQSTGITTNTLNITHRKYNDHQQYSIVNNTHGRVQSHEQLPTYRICHPNINQQQPNIIINNLEYKMHLQQQQIAHQQQKLSRLQMQLHAQDKNSTSPIRKLQIARYSEPYMLQTNHQIYQQESYSPPIHHRYIQRTPENHNIPHMQHMQQHMHTNRMLNMGTNTFIPTNNNYYSNIPPSHFPTSTQQQKMVMPYRNNNNTYYNVAPQKTTRVKTKEMIQYSHTSIAELTSDEDDDDSRSLDSPMPWKNRHGEIVFKKLVHKSSSTGTIHDNMPRKVRYRKVHPKHTYGQSDGESSMDEFYEYYNQHKVEYENQFLDVQRKKPQMKHEHHYALPAVNQRQLITPPQGRRPTDGIIFDNPNAKPAIIVTAIPLEIRESRTYGTPSPSSHYTQNRSIIIPQDEHQSPEAPNVADIVHNINSRYKPHRSESPLSPFSQQFSAGSAASFNSKVSNLICITPAPNIEYGDDNERLDYSNASVGRHHHGIIPPLSSNPSKITQTRSPKYFKTSNFEFTEANLAKHQAVFDQLPMLHATKALRLQKLKNTTVINGTYNGLLGSRTSKISYVNTSSLPPLSPFNEGVAVDDNDGGYAALYAASIGSRISSYSIESLSQLSTDSSRISRVFHPRYRLQMSKFHAKHSANKQNFRNPFETINEMTATSNSVENKTVKDDDQYFHLHPQSRSSMVADYDPLDDLQNMSVLMNYDKHREIGTGTDAFVYEVIDRRDKSHVAMKLTKRKSGRYKTEIHLLHQLRSCPYIVKLLNCLENESIYVLILEHAPMSLEKLLLQKCTHNAMQSRVARPILTQIIRGMKAIHALGFVHKDIKPENVLIFANKDKRRLTAKVADFGFATRVQPDSNLCKLSDLPPEKKKEFEKHVRDRCGTPGFWSPELVAQIVELEYAFRMDVFSAGVTLYRMLCNEMPFGTFEKWKFTIEQNKNGECIKKLAKVKPNWKIISWLKKDINGTQKYTPILSNRKLSDQIKDLLRRMLRIRPQYRLSVDECLNHPFFQRSNSNSTGKRTANIASPLPSLYDGRSGASTLSYHSGKSSTTANSPIINVSVKNGNQRPSKRKRSRQSLRKRRTFGMNESKPLSKSKKRRSKISVKIDVVDDDNAWNRSKSAHHSFNFNMFSKAEKKRIRSQTIGKTPVMDDGKESMVNSKPNVDESFVFVDYQEKESENDGKSRSTVKNGSKKSYKRRKSHGGRKIKTKLKQNNDYL